MVTGFAQTNPQHRVNTPGLRSRQLDHARARGAGRSHHLQDALRRRGGPLRFPDGSPGDGAACAGAPAAFGSASAPGSHRGAIGLEPVRSRLRRVGPLLHTRQRRITRGTRSWPARLSRAESRPGDRARDAGRLGPRRRRARCFRSPAAAVRDAERGRPDHVGVQPDVELSGAWPERFAASAFVAEPVHNLVHRDRYAPAGSTFVGPARARARREFLASTDPWFRPVNLYRRTRRRALRRRLLPAAHRAPGMDGERSPRRFAARSTKATIAAASTG